MKLSEQIAQTCCGVLADRQEMIDKAIRLEEDSQMFTDFLEALNKKNGRG